MEKEYLNKFIMTNELSNLISSIISKYENNAYICEVLRVTIPEHKGLVYKSPLDNYVSYGGGLNALSGAQMREIEEKYGEHVVGIIPEETLSFLIIMKSDSYKEFKEMSFDNKESVQSTLNSLCDVCLEYTGHFDSSDLVIKFPYLEELFNYLNDWREANNRATIDDKVLRKTRFV